MPIQADRIPASPPSRAALAKERDPESPYLGRRPGPWPPQMEIPAPPQNPNNKPLGSWARRPNYKANSNTSGETRTTTTTNSSVEISNADPLPPPSKQRPRPPPQRDMDNVALRINGHTPKDNTRPPPLPSKENVRHPRDRERLKSAEPFTPVLPPPPPPVPLEKKANPEVEPANGPQSSGPIRPEQPSSRAFRDPDVDLLSLSQEADDVIFSKQSHLKYEIRESPGLVPLILYGFQQYLSIAGSVILIPLVIVPAMGGSDDDMARVVSTVLLVTGLSTLLHTFLGSRLPLIQGSSFVYLAPALSIIHTQEFLSIGENRFKKTMRELQGAILIASAFQFFLGYSGLLSVLLRFINPVVVAPTVAAVGLAFFSYGFPLVGTCVEIGIPQILVILCFALYLRKISVLGHRIFQVYAVPLGLGIIWAYAFLLTEAGAYNFKGCDMNIPTSNILSESCRHHVFTMRHCRTDTSGALRNASWFRFPYPFQWGIPTFHWKSGGVMVAASIIATVDSVGTYHASSLLVASRAPTPGVVSRAIGLEGLTSALAGIWGIGTGANTLTENVHTIAVTKMGSRRVIEFGACVLIVLSVVGKVGAFIASIPTVLVAALLCIMWTMLTALGLSNLRYSETGSSRNVLIVGLSLFLSLSVPAYFQHYGTTTMVATVPSYFQPYTVSAHGPIKTGIIPLDYFLNTVLSFHMVISFIVAFILDNTVPGSRQERGTYVWSKPASARNEPAVVKDYCLPGRLPRFFTWARWVGL